MSYKLETAEGFEHFKETLISIDTLFSQAEGTIHKARNELKRLHIHNLDVIIKEYKIPNLLNQFVYAHIRKSKAYKAFHYAKRLKELNVSTPDPVGYIEFFKFGMLQKSYFISLEYKYDFTMAHIRDDQPAYKEEVLEAFALFTYQLHTKGIWHSDYSGGNILIQKNENSYDFSIVDINRMKFFPIQGYKGLENFNKLWLNEEDLTTIATSYALAAGLDRSKAIETILYHDRKLKNKVELKRKLRGK